MKVGFRLNSILILLLVLLAGVHCGDSTTSVLGLGDEGGVAGDSVVDDGTIFYFFPTANEAGGEEMGGYSGEGETDDGSWDDANASSSENAGAVDTGSFGEEGVTTQYLPSGVTDSYLPSSGSSPSEDGVEIPVTIAKCELPSDDEDDGEDEDESNTTTTAKTLAKAVLNAERTRRTTGQSASSTELSLRGGRGTYPIGRKDLFVIMANVSTGDIVTTAVKGDGSFDTVTLQATFQDDLIWIAATDGYELIKSVVFEAADGDDFDAAQASCELPSDSDNNLIYRAMIDRHFSLSN